MPVDVREEGSDMVVITLQGRMAPADQAVVLDFLTKTAERAGKIRLLAVLRDFEGWTIGEEWADDALRLQSDEPIMKAAIVGEVRWKDEVYAYISKPFRKTPIEYFESEVAARSWLTA